MQEAEAPIGPGTPVAKRRSSKSFPARTGFGFMMNTPEATKRSMDTPPTSPMLLQRRLEDDIDSAVHMRSVPLLSLALQRGHRCSADHCLYEVVHRCHECALEFLLEEHGNIDVDEQCRGRRPIHEAVQACSVEGDVGHRMAEALLRHGARPDPIDGDDCAADPPLHVATKRGNASTVSLLLAHRANPNVADSNGHTALHIASRAPPLGLHEKAVLALLSYGANPVRPDAAGMVPGRYARDIKLRVVLRQAEHVYSQGTVLAARGRGRLCAEAPVSICLLSPELFGCIVDFL